MTAWRGHLIRACKGASCLVSDAGKTFKMPGFLQRLQDSGFNERAAQPDYIVIDSVIRAQP